MKMQLTNNFYTWAKTILFGNTKENLIYTSSANTEISSSNISYKTLGKLFNTAGNELSSIIVAHYYSNNGSWHRINTTSLACFDNNNSIGNYAYTYFKVGASNKEVSLDDIELDSLISTGVVYGLQAMHSTAGLSFLLSVTNTTGGEIQIGEIGFYKDLISAPSGTVLFGRHAFSEKILIAPNQTRVFEILIEI